MENPYTDYTVGLTYAARAAIEAVTAKYDLRYRETRGDTHDGEATVFDMVIELAGSRYRQYGALPCIAGYFDVDLDDDVRLHIHIDQRARTRWCWKVGEIGNGKVTACFIDDTTTVLH